MFEQTKTSLLIGVAAICLTMGVVEYGTQGKLTPDGRSLIHDAVVCILAIKKDNQNEKSDSKKTDKSDSSSQ